MDIDVARDIVRASAAELDKKFPGWRDSVDPGILNMDSCSYCVAGQIGGRVPGGYRRVVGRIDPDVRVLGGFGLADSYGNIERAWREVIAGAR